jgi:hypothetical protein
MGGRDMGCRLRWSIAIIAVTERERAWAALHDAIGLMPGWAVGPCVYHGEAALWHVAAIDLLPHGRLAKREAITDGADGGATRSRNASTRRSMSARCRI